MKKVIGNKAQIITFFLASIFVCSLFSCQNKYDYQDEIIVIKHFMRYHDNPDNMTINVLNKYEITSREIYYYIEWSDLSENDNKTYDLLMIYNPQIRQITLAFFADMEAGLFSDVKQKWAEVKDSPMMVLSKEEILKIKQNAIEILNQENPEK